MSLQRLHQLLLLTTSYYRRGLRSIAAEIEEREDCAKRRAQRELARDKNKVSVPAKEPISPHSESELR